MAITFKAKDKKASSNNTDVTTDGVDTTGATLLVAWLMNAQAVASNTLTDSKGNTWITLAVAEENAATNRGRWWYVNSNTPTVGAAHQIITSTVSNSFPTLFFYAFDGSAATPADQENGQATGTNQVDIQPGSITPSEAGCVVLCSVGWYNGTATAISINGGFSTPDTIVTATNNIPGGASYLIQTTATAANPQWAWTGLEIALSSIVSLKSSGGAPATPLILTPMYNPFRSKNEIVSY